MTHDLAVIGGGILGLATADRVLSRFPGLRLILLEKEPRLASHQTGHNSGVIHTGLYYRPGSHRARLCVSGAKMLKEFCREEGIPFETCGKVVVATEESQLPRLEDLFRRGTENGVSDLALVGPEELRRIEPRAYGLRALHARGAAIVDYGAVANRLAERIARAGGEVAVGTRVRSFDGGDRGVSIRTDRGPVDARFVITCAGLQADRIAKRSGSRVDSRIVPFLGEYYRFTEEAEDWVRGLIYPVPDPRFPFLGIHLTRRIDGGVEAGPNAVLALDREGYRKLAMNPRDLLATLFYRGFWRFFRRHAREGMSELVRSVSKRRFVRSVQQMLPSIRSEHLTRAGAGVRAQMLDPSGDLVDDFRFVEEPGFLHLLNAPSPAGTSCLALANEVVDRAERSPRFQETIG